MPESTIPGHLLIEQVELSIATAEKLANMSAALVAAGQRLNGKFILTARQAKMLLNAADPTNSVPHPAHQSPAKRQELPIGDTAFSQPHIAQPIRQNSLRAQDEQSAHRICRCDDAAGQQPFPPQGAHAAKKETPPQGRSVFRLPSRQLQQLVCAIRRLLAAVTRFRS